MLKNLSIPASVEQYPLTAKLDQRGESPGFGHRRGLPKCVVENRDAIGASAMQRDGNRKTASKKLRKRRNLMRYSFPKQDWRGLISSGIVAPWNVSCQGRRKAPGTLRSRSSLGPPGAGLPVFAGHS